MASTSADFSLLAFPSSARTVQVVSQSGSELLEISSISTVTRTLFIGTDFILLGTNSGLVECYSLRNGTLLSTAAAPSETPVNTLLAVSSGVYAGSEGSGMLSFITVDSDGRLSVAESLKADSQALLTCSSHGDRLVTVSKKRLRLWDMSNKSLTTTVALSQSIDSVFVSKVDVFCVSGNTISKLQDDTLVNIFDLPHVHSIVSSSTNSINVLAQNELIVLDTHSKTLVSRSRLSGEFVAVASNRVMIRLPSGSIGLQSTLMDTVDECAALIEIAKAKSAMYHIPRIDNSITMNQIVDFVTAGQTIGCSMKLSERTESIVEKQFHEMSKQSGLCGDIKKVCQTMLSTAEKKHELLRRIQGKFSYILTDNKETVADVSEELGSPLKDDSLQETLSTDGGERSGISEEEEFEVEDNADQSDEDEEDSDDE